MDDELRRLRRALDTMAEPDLDVFERARFAGEDYPTIAATLGIDVAEVERRMASAMLHLARAR